MDTLETLRKLASGGTPTSGTAATANILRFVLEPNPHAREGSSPEQIRAKLYSLLKSEHFWLDGLFKTFRSADFLVLSFPGVERTMPPDILYRIAGVLRDELGLISCEPDTGDAIYADPDIRLGSSSETAIVDAYCMASGAPPADRMWAIKNIGAVDSWSDVPSLGAGIRIAQLDTGIAKHDEFAETVMDLASSINLLEGGTDPTDPLRSGTANPGHGTATASAAVSGRSGQVSGSAPGATLVPIRCIEDVKVFDASPIARGIEHAIAVDAHVITMSLGGAWSRAVERIVAEAVARDIIIVAAAGNCVGLVVWPAAYPDVIAVGGSGPGDLPWRGSSNGKKIEFTAPAEFVWVADRRSISDPLDKLHAGQGTSFATALSAGAAALWLARFGRDEVILEARRREVSVQELFRAACRQTCRVPSGWDTDRYGSGILNCEALLDLPLESISLGAEARVAGVAAALEAVLGPGAVDADFDWAAHGAEVSGLLIADSRAGRGQEEGGLEVKAFRFSSDSLISSAHESKDPRMSLLVERSGMQAAGLVTAPNVDEARKETLLRELGRMVTREAHHEAVESMNGEEGRRVLGTAEAERMMASLRGRLREHADPRLAGLIDVLSGPIERLRLSGTQAHLSEIETISLEALVELQGRPALPVKLRHLEGTRSVQTVDADHPELGAFQGLVNIHLPRLEDDCLPSVGRIDADGRHIGTGFSIAPGLVLTNRHVLQHFAAPTPSATNPDRWLMVREASINFSPAADDPREHFIVRDVVFAGPDPIRDDVVDFAKLDLALLRVDQSNPSDGKFPKPVGLDVASDLASQHVFVVGYPAAPSRLPLDDTGRVRQDVVEALRRYYGISYAQKFFSPGAVKSTPKDWWFQHDATTLAGNSGSLVCNFGSMKACGLHFAGDWLRANHAHDIAAVLTRMPALYSAIRNP